MTRHRVPARTVVTTLVCLLAMSGALGQVPLAGERCDPNDVDGRGQLVCASTQETEWLPAQLMNGQKGDIVMVSGCGPIGELIRAVDGYQVYSHTGIMASNYSHLFHATGTQELFEHPENLEECPADLGSGCNGIKEHVLKYVWPGVEDGRADSIAEAFEGHVAAGPDGHAYILKGFSSAGVQCGAGEDMVFPIVVKPPFAAEAAARPSAEAIADGCAEAASGLGVHYRFYGYTKAAIFSDPSFEAPVSTWAHAENRQPAVCSSLIAACAHLAGVQVDGEAEPITEGSFQREECDASFDGIYRYSAGERIQAGTVLYNNVKNKIDSRVGSIAEYLFNVSDRTAGQLANCFALDVCWPLPNTGEPVLSSLTRLWADSGEGCAVSPEDIRDYWDAPPKGIYGFEERIWYQPSGEGEVFRWRTIPGYGAIEGQVLGPLKDGRDGAVVYVVGPRGLLALTDDEGRYRIDGVPSGEYVVEVVAPFRDCQHWGPPANWPAISRERVVVPIDGAVRQNFSVMPDCLSSGRIQPGTRAVGVNLTMQVHDDENSPEFSDGTTCQVATSGRDFNRGAIQVAAIPNDDVWPTYECRCCGEIRIETQVSFELDPSTGGVSVGIFVDLYEGTSTDNEDLDGHGEWPDAFIVGRDAVSSLMGPYEVRNEDEGGDWVKVYVSVSNDAWRTPDY